jgi:hypothetical protein
MKVEVEARGRKAVAVDVDPGGAPTKAIFVFGAGENFDPRLKIGRRTTKLSRIMPVMRIKIHLYLNIIRLFRDPA